MYHSACSIPSLPTKGISNDISAVNHLFWTLFNHFKLRAQTYKEMTGKNALLAWARDAVSIYPSMNDQHLTIESGFNNGVVFCYINHWYNPDSVRLDLLSYDDAMANFCQCFDSSWRRFRVPFYIENFNINERTVSLFLSSLYELLKGQNRVRAWFNHCSD